MTGRLRGCLTDFVFPVLQRVPGSGLDEGGQNGEDSVHHEDEPAL